MAITSRKLGDSSVRVEKTIGTSQFYSTMSTWENNTGSADITTSIVYTVTENSSYSHAHYNAFLFYDVSNNLIGIANLIHPIASGASNFQTTFTAPRQVSGEGNLQWNTAVTGKYYNDNSKTITINSIQSVAGSIEIGLVNNETLTGTNALVNIAGATTSTTRFRVLKAKTAPNGVLANYPHLNYSGSSIVVSVGESNARVHNIRATSAGNHSANGHAFLATGSNSNIVFAGCIASGVTNSGSGGGYGFYSYLPNVGLAINCLSN